MKIKREILAKMFADLAKIVFALLVVGKFINAEAVSWQVFFFACLTLISLGLMVWLIAPQEQETKRRKKQ